MTRRWTLACLALLCLPATPVLADALLVPGNDTCAGAVTIPGAGPFPYLTTPVDLVDATTSGDPTPTCPADGLFSRGIWYRFTPTATAAYRITTCATEAPGTTRDDTVLAVYTAGSCAGPFTQAACNDDDAACGFSELESTLSVGMTAGTTYYVVAYSWGTGPPPSGASTVQLQVLRVPPPANDICSGALTLPLGSAVGSNASAANNYTLSGAACFTGIGQSASIANGRESVWSFTAPSAGSYSFRAQTFDAGGSGDLVLYTAPTCPGPGVISCAAPVRAANRTAATANFTAAEEILCQPMAGGEQTFVFVDEGAFTPAGGGYLLEATRCGQEAEPNGAPASASAITACPMEGSISPNADVDFYALGTPASGTRVFAVADGVQAGNGDFDMRITTSTDTLEYDNSDNVSLNGGAGPNIAGRALTGVASFVSVNHNSAVTQSQPYRLYRVLQPPSSSATPEANNANNNLLDFAEAAGNGYFAGTFSQFNATTGEDLDLYKFCALQDDVISIGIDADPGRNLTPVNPSILLYDEDGFSLALLNDPNVSSNNTSGAGSLTAVTPNSPGEALTWRARYTGAYYVATNPTASTNVPANADYLLSIGLNCESTSGFTATLGTDLTAPAAVNAGDTFDYTLTLTNSGPKTALEAEFVDTLPAGVTYVGVTGTGTDIAVCTQEPPVGSGGTLRCRVDCLRPGGNFTFVITVQAAPCSGNVNRNNSVAVTSKTPLQPGSVVNDSVSVAVTDTGTCSDGLSCTTGDHCQGGSCTGTPLGSPAEVTGLGFQSKSAFSWGATTGAFTYDALRGNLSALPVGPGGADEVCFNDVVGTGTSDGATPGAGAGFWYLVRGKNTCAPAGTWGNASSGPRSTTTCP